MNRKELAHLWAHKAQPSGRASTFYFEGDTIYSFGPHFPIARHYKGVVLFTTQRVRQRTAAHISATAYACHHMQVFHVHDPSRNPSGKDVNAYALEIDKMVTRAARARDLSFLIDQLRLKVDNANLFCEHFGFKTRFSMPANIDELEAKAKINAAKIDAAKIKRQKREEAAAQESIQKWLAGESITIPYTISRVYLRAKHSACESINGNEPDAMVMQTSKGAVVPLADAERAFKFCMKMREKGWHRNGETFKVGHYQLDAVNSDGVIAGCHRITWQTIEEFAKQQGWIK
jgi:hypothetical protein